MGHSVVPARLPDPYIKRHIAQETTALTLKVEDPVKGLPTEPGLAARWTLALALCLVTSSEVFREVVINRYADLLLERSGQLPPILRQWAIETGKLIVGESFCGTGSDEKPVHRLIGVLPPQYVLVISRLVG